jgi:Mannosyltransferase (PIG-V)
VKVRSGTPVSSSTVVSAGQRLRAARPPAAPLADRATTRPALELFLWSRAAIWIGAVLAFAWFEPNRHPLADRWDVPFNHDLGWGLDLWARWDSGWYLQIAEEGYGAEGTAAFFPLYPALVGGLGRVLGGHFVLAGVIVSLAACLGAFLLLYRLAESRLGAEGARRTVLLLAVFPFALFLQAVYPESLFLLLTLGAFLLAERGRWPAAGAVAGLALLARPAGLALLPALAVLAWRSADRTRALASLALAPALFAVFPLFLHFEVGDAWAFAREQGIWNRELSPLGPLGGVWEGVRAVVTGEVPTGAGALHAHAVNAQALAFLALFLALTVVAWRRFGAPYGLLCAASLALPLSVPSERWPLLSLPRFGLVVFPFFLALAALAAGRPRLHTALVAGSALLLGVAVVQWATWQWVA